MTWTWSATFYLPRALPGSSARRRSHLIILHRQDVQGEKSSSFMSMPALYALICLVVAQLASYAFFSDIWQSQYLGGSLSSLKRLEKECCLMPRTSNISLQRYRGVLTGKAVQRRSKP